MVNYLIVAIGQCGNQLTYEFLNMIYDHCIKNHEYFEYHKQKSNSSKSTRVRKGSAKKGSETKRIHPYFHEKKANSGNKDTDIQETLLSSFFRRDETSNFDSSQDRFTARVICLDTEPKVIHDCVEKAKAHIPSQSIHRWHYDESGIAFRHSGAGNNWALGYSIATGDFLETALDKIRREIEKCDDIPVLIYIHSLAGGTGSGLGTHLAESSYELFSNCFHYHILISPHSFSEVIVQYYNTLLCLSKIHHNTDGILIFDNENAQLLCKQMKFIEKPLLADLNQVISNHLVPLFLPKRHSTLFSAPPPNTTNNYESLFFSSSSLPVNSSSSSSSGFRFTHLNDDLTYLCSNPNYRFFNVKLSPQTSIDSIDFTYDSWFTLVNAIQRMQLSGTLSERNILPYVKQFGKKDDSPHLNHGVSSSWRNKSKSLSSSSQDFNHHNRSHSQDRDHELSTVVEHDVLDDDNDNDLDAIFPLPKIPPQEMSFQSPPAHHRTALSINNPPRNNPLSVVKSVASIICCHGEGAHQAIHELESQFHEDTQQEISSSSHHRPVPSDLASVRSSKTSFKSMSGTSSAYVNAHQNQPKLFEEYLQSHSSFHSLNQLPIQFASSNFLLNQYQRSTTVLSNDQSILPLLQRTIKKSAEMFQVRAYLHQYLSHGLEMDDFVDSFQSLGSVVQYYSDL
jgi:hypothetical protein